MRPSLANTDRPALRAAWRQWTAVVSLYARRVRLRRGVDPAAYGVIHHEVVTICRGLVRQHEGAERAYYESLLDLAQPWLSVRTLTQADSAVLRDLLGRCQGVERDLGGPRVNLAQAGRWLAVLLGLATLALAVFVVARGSGLDPAWWLDRLHGWSEAVWQAVRQTSDWTRLLAVTVLVVLVSVRAASRTARF